MRQWFLWKQRANMLTSYYRIFKFLKPTMFARVIWPSSSWENWNSCNICKSLDTLATITVMKNKVLCLWHRRLMSSPSIHKTVSVLWQSNLLPCKLSKNIRPFAVLERCFGSEDGMLRQEFLEEEEWKPRSLIEFMGNPWKLVINMLIKLYGQPGNKWFSTLLPVN